jgi:hypothetical protein
MKNNTAFNQLKKKLKTNKAYRQTWIANLAMAYYDESALYKWANHKKYLTQKDRHVIANEAAERFLNNLCK